MYKICLIDDKTYWIPQLINSIPKDIDYKFYYYDKIPYIENIDFDIVVLDFYLDKDNKTALDIIERFLWKIIIWFSSLDSKIVYSRLLHKYQNWFKVFISLSNQYKTIIDSCWMTQSIAFIRCNWQKEAKKIKSELDNDIYLFLNNITRYWNFNNVRVLQNFTLLKYIKLNKEEENFIKKFNQEYYRNKKVNK